VSDQFPPGLLRELDQHIRRIAEEVADERLGQVSLTGGREWLTASQAAEILSCSPEAIRKRAKRGRNSAARRARSGCATSAAAWKAATTGAGSTSVQRACLSFGRDRPMLLRTTKTGPR
jgi:hypothetical protein